MKTCPKCGSKQKSSVTFCSKCGYKFQMQQNAANNVEQTSQVANQATKNVAKPQTGTVTITFNKSETLKNLLLIVVIILCGLGVFWSTKYYKNRESEIANNPLSYQNITFQKFRDGVDVSNVSYMNIRNRVATLMVKQSDLPKSTADKVLKYLEIQYPTDYEIYKYHDTLSKKDQKKEEKLENDLFKIMDQDENVFSISPKSSLEKGRMVKVKLSLTKKGKQLAKKYHLNLAPQEVKVTDIAE